MDFHPVHFEFDGPYRSFAGAVARRSVVYPLFGRYDDCGALNQQYIELVRLWRRLVDGLRGQQTPLNDKRLAICYSCMPPGVRCLPEALICGCPYICPCCWGRAAQNVFRGLRNVFGGLPEHYRQDYCLTAFRCENIVPQRGRRQDAFMSSVIRAVASARKTLVRKLDLSGSYVSTSLEPRQNGTWAVSVRGLLVSGQTLGRDGLGCVFRGVCRVRSSRAPSVAAIARLVPWALPYPKDLLFAPIERVAAYLRARAGHRLSASYGCLRSYVRTDVGAPAELSEEVECQSLNPGPDNPSSSLLKATPR